MHRSLNLPEIFLLISLAMIAIEAAFAQWSIVKARYHVKDTAASLGMQVGNIVMNLGMAGVVFAGLTAAYEHRLARPLAVLALGMGRIVRPRRFHVLLVSSHQPRVPLLVGRPRQSSLLAGVQFVDRRPPVLDQRHRRHLDALDSARISRLSARHDSCRAGLQPVLSILDSHGSRERMPRWFEYLFNTPSHHRVHHASNPRYLDRNYAGVLMVWDRLFGTFAEECEQEPPRYGIVKNIDTFNPVRIAFHEWTSIARDLIAARSWREAVGRGVRAARMARRRQGARPRRIFETNGAYANMQTEPKLTGLSGNEIYCMRLKGLTPSGVVHRQQHPIHGISRRGAFGFSRDRRRRDSGRHGNDPRGTRGRVRAHAGGSQARGRARRGRRDFGAAQPGRQLGVPVRRLRGERGARCGKPSPVRATRRSSTATWTRAMSRASSCSAISPIPWARWAGSPVR